MRRTIVLAAALLLSRTAGAQTAHAHNDYEHARPLLDALERGFTSIEADIHLVNGQLLVAHHRDSVDATRTLEALYLAPLRAHVQQPGPPLVLLIDVKSHAESTYVVLDSLLRRYADMLTIFAGDTMVEGRVLAVVSGERAITTMRRAPVRFAAVDGRLADLRASPRAPRTLVPLISDSWQRITKWKGVGPVPVSVRADITRIVARAHQRGQRVRFWGTGDHEAVWRVLADAKVDVIGADDLDALKAFLARRRP